MLATWADIFAGHRQIAKIPALMIGTKMTLRGFDRDEVSLRQSSPPSVIPAKAGIQRGGEGKCSAEARPPLPAGRQPTLIPSHREADPPTGAPIFVPWYAGPRRHERLVRN